MDSSVVSDNLVKSGEQMVQLSLRRSAKGVILNVKTHPLIETFFREQANEQLNVQEFRNEWTPLSKEAPLIVWHTTQNAGVVKGGNVHYRTDRPGDSLVNSDGGSEVVNISFLRLVGSSLDGGVAFEVRGAYSLKYLQTLAGKLVQASKQFYIDFLKPVDITVTINTQETR
jgi:hypothetical protein